MEPTVAAGLCLLGILIPIFYIGIGKRKKVIDKFESDVQILLIFVIVICLYLLFYSISLIFSILFFYINSLKYLILSIYFLLPIFLGIFLYEFLPWLVGRRLRLKDIKTPGNVQEISYLLGLVTTPHVKTTSLRISPLVYGRGKKESVFVLPESISILTEKEQKAVITHELSHIYQGDVGFFTWLTILMEGFKYWIAPLPLAYAEFVYSIHSEFPYPFIFELRSSLVAIFLFPVLVLLLFFSLVFLKNSLSRTRESMADAYAVFHGFDISLETALFKYKDLRASKSGGILNLCFYRGARSKLGLSTHPPFYKRIHDIEEKTLLRETNTNLSHVLAFCTGVTSAFLFYTVRHFFINVCGGLHLSPPAEFGVFITGVIPFIGASSVVALSYVFPFTKTPLRFSDLVRRNFLFPLVRNVTITATAAAVTSYGLFINMEYTVILTECAFCGFLMSFAGLLGNRFNDFNSKDWYLLCAPFLLFFLLWYPVKIIHSFFSHAPIEPLAFIYSMLYVLILNFLILFFLAKRGYIDINSEKRILHFFKKTKEFINVSNLIFTLLVLCALLIVPTVVSIMLYIIFCTGKTFITVPTSDFLIAGILLVLLLYITRTVIAFNYFKLSLLTDIVLSGNGIDKTYSRFIEKVIKEYQSPDGGFHHEARGFSNQKGTFFHVKTAATLGISLNERVREWIWATEKEEGGFSFIIGGHPQVEALYYAVQSLFLLRETRDMSRHSKWILDSFNGRYFRFENDTCSPLLQTCYAVESLSFLGALEIQDMDSCRQWIKTHFPVDLMPEEAFFATRALKVLNSDMKVAEEWLTRNKGLLTTRTDKNTENIYYYVKVLYELDMPMPVLIVEQATQELAKIRKEYEKMFV